MIDFRAELIKELHGVVEGDVELETPPDYKLGDFALPCFAYAKKLKKSPNQIAQDIAKKVKLSVNFSKIEVVGPYINFFIDNETLAGEVIKQNFLLKNKYGKQKKIKKKYMVEFSQANTHKAFHVGHLRGTSIGESLSRILEFSGFEIIRANYQGDTGAHVAKWLWCYEKFHNNEEPPKDNPEEWIANIYVEAVKKTNEDTQKEIDEVNFHLENGDDKALKQLWEKSKKWSLDSLDGIYKDLDAHFDVLFFEGDLEIPAKKISQKLLKTGIAQISEGATLIDLEKFNLGKWILLRKDGTCLYSAKDLALAEEKFSRYKVDKSIYVVGAAQSLHLKQLFKTLDIMGFEYADKCAHLSFSEVRLPTGQMSSRTGENILYTKLKEKLYKKIMSEVEKRHSDWDEKRKIKSAKNIFSSAIKFDMLVQDPNKNIIFDIDKAMDFEGETGPYIQYTYARINSIFRKYAKNIKKDVKFELLKTEIESKLIREIYQFPNLIIETSKQLKPSLLARYLISISQKFNEFYHSNKILGEEKNLCDARLALSAATSNILSIGLTLLGINCPDEM